MMLVEVDGLFVMFEEVWMGIVLEVVWMVV